MLIYTMCFSRLHLLPFLDAQFISSLTNGSTFLIAPVSCWHNSFVSLSCFLTQHGILGSPGMFPATDLGPATPPLQVPWFLLVGDGSYTSQIPCCSLSFEGHLFGLRFPLKEVVLSSDKTSLEDVMKKSGWGLRMEWDSTSSFSWGLYMRKSAQWNSIWGRSTGLYNMPKPRAGRGIF